jgi:signal transduction histidine kinase
VRGQEEEAAVSTTETTVELPRENAYADPLARTTALAGLALVAGLALALLDVDARWALGVLGGGVVLGLFVLIPLAVDAINRHPALLVGAVGLGLLVFALLFFGYFADGRVLWDIPSLITALIPLAIIGVAAFGGLILIADDLRTRFGLAQRGLTPWQRLMGTTDVPAPAPWRLFGGLALVGLAGIFGLGVIGVSGGGGLMSLALLLVLGGGAAAIIAVPLFIAGLARSDRARLTTAREDERRRVAAHLHDSVLQTLALVQRQAHDPAAVQRLARRQEHELRAWMAGEVELGAETLGAALRRAVAEVEDDYDAVVELTILGERGLDRSAEALAAAAREALRNAARHAAGSPIFVFAQASADGAEVFVRDEGPGFELGSVPTERRGVRDSIVGRMVAVGGSAVIDSHPGEGTEVALRIGVTGS